MLPLEYKAPRLSAPMVTYPCDRSRDALDRLAKSGEPDAKHGVKMHASTPPPAEYPLPTIGAFLQLLPKGFSGLHGPIDRCDRFLRG
jgi:gentisate 1,2-dioxygenase